MKTDFNNVVEAVRVLAKRNEALEKALADARIEIAALKCEKKQLIAKSKSPITDLCRA